MGNNMPDYENYTLKDLFQARGSVNKDAYPERLVEIDRLIEERLNAPRTVKGKQQGSIDKYQRLPTESQQKQKVSKYDTFWQRFFAMLLDSIALMVLFGVVSSVAQWLGWWTVPVAVTYQYFSYITYSILCHGLAGKTLGKFLTGIVVIDAKTEGRIGFKHAALRDSVLLAINLVNYVIVMIAWNGGGKLTETMQQTIMWVGLFALVWGLLELITMLFNEKRRAIHDFIGGTVVIRKLS